MRHSLLLDSALIFLGVACGGSNPPDGSPNTGVAGQKSSTVGTAVGGTAGHGARPTNAGMAGSTAISSTGGFGGLVTSTGTAMGGRDQSTANDGTVADWTSEPAATGGAAGNTMGGTIAATGGSSSVSNGGQAASAIGGSTSGPNGSSGSTNASDGGTSSGGIQGSTVAGATSAVAAGGSLTPGSSTAGAGAGTSTATAGTMAAGGVTAIAGNTSTAGAGGGQSASPFQCSELGSVAADASARTCIDFSHTDDALAFAPQGGVWAVVDGAYIGNGPDADVTCVGAGSLMTASTLAGFSAANVRVHFSATSLDQVDKVLVLRSRDPGNRIELNFRASYSYNGMAKGGDLVIQELVNCDYVEHVAPGVLSVPHNPLQTIAADVELRGQVLKVTVDGNVVFNGSLELSTDAGSVGFAVFYNSIEMFDDLVVETLI